MYLLRISFALIVVAAAVSGCGPSRSEALRDAANEVMAEQATANPMVGKPAPIFEVATLEKEPKKVKLSDYRGKVVVIDFWATWCGPCRALMPYVQTWHEKYAGDGLQIMAISNESADVIRRFKASRSETYPTFHDSNREATAMFGVQVYPTVAVIDRKGVVRWMGVPEPGQIENIVRSLLKEA